jgi:GMP synthase (glutamine-hydrolysing)
MRILSILHPGGGHSGLLRDQAASAGHALREWTPGAGEPQPEPLEAFDAIALFGGGMNVSDRDRLPWLTGEISLLGDALAARMPVLGICLGAQLVAAAAGAAVRRAARPEIGWHPVERLAARFAAYSWHSYTYELPSGAVELARSPVCSQAFVLDGHVWAVQFHPEVTPDVLDAWIGDWRSDPDAVAQGYDPASARNGLPDRLRAWHAIGRTLFDGWLEEAAALTTRA